MGRWITVPLAVAMRTEQKEQNLIWLLVRGEADTVEKGGLVDGSTNMTWISGPEMLPGYLATAKSQS